MILRIGRTRLKISFSFVALIAIMVMLCDERIVLCSLLSSLIHESGHLFFMLLSGDAPKNIEMSLFGFEIDRSNKVRLSYKKEMLISLGGIIFNMIFSIFSLIIYNLSQSEEAFLFSGINFVVAAVNAFPVSVLDCGQTVKYFLLLHFDSEKSEKYAECISVVFTLIFTASSFIYLLLLGVNISLVAVNIYLIIINVLKKWS